MKGRCKLACGVHLGKLVWCWGREEDGEGFGPFAVCPSPLGRKQSVWGALGWRTHGTTQVEEGGHSAWQDGGRVAPGRYGRQEPEGGGEISVSELLTPDQALWTGGWTGYSVGYPV